jgi:hypothetical protein
MAKTEFATRSHKGAGFLFLLGFALVAAGAGFALAPHFSWQVELIARKASAFGIQNGALVVGGLVLFGLGIVARVAGSAAPAPASSATDEGLQSELHLLNEQFSTKFAQLRNSLLQLNDGLTAVAAQQQAEFQSRAAQPGPGDQSQDAVFRLAASLDKLHAHLDERVHAVDLQLRSGFETLLQASHDMRRLLGQGVALAPAPGHAAQGHHVVHAHPQHAAHPQEALQPEGGIDFYETMQKLDAIAGPDGSLAQEHQPQAPFPSQGQPDQSLDALLPEEYRDRY